MAQRSLDFWFDYSCPYAYLASTQVEALAERTGARLSWRPMLLGGVFAANGTAQKLFATLSAPKAAHNARDLDRWAEVFGVTLRMPPEHPFRTVEALRATVACGVDPRVVHVTASGLLGRSAQILPIPGSGSPEHVAENVSAASLRLTTDEANAILNLAG